VMVLAILAGQLTTAAVFDLVLPIEGHLIAPVTIAGTALTLVAVAIAAIPPRGGRPRRGSATRVTTASSESSSR
jgi:transporter family-2 protein